MVSPTRGGSPIPRIQCIRASYSECCFGQGLNDIFCSDFMNFLYLSRVVFHFDKLFVSDVKRL